MDKQALTNETAALWAIAVEYAPRIAGAIIVLIVGGMIANWLSAIVTRAIDKTKIDPTFRPMLATGFHYLLLGVIGLIVLQQFGVQTASLLAVLGTAGLAIGLALQGTLSNVAAGLVLLLLRPFEVGDQVEVSGQIGTVLGLALFHTNLRTDDGADVLVPNKAVLDGSIRNMSRYPDRVISMTITVSGSADLEKAVAVLTQTLDAQPLVIKTLGRNVSVAVIKGDTNDISVSAWVKNGDYDAARTQFLTSARTALKTSGVDLA